MKSLDLFVDDSASVQTIDATSIPFTLESPEERALRRIRSIMDLGHVCVIAFSAGKDSSCLASLVLQCAVEMKGEGFNPPPIIVTHSSTLVENPEVTRLATSELEKMRLYASRYGLDFRALVGTPELNVTFVTRVIGGTTLPSFASSRSAQCSIDWKSRVGRKLIDMTYEEASSNLSTWGKPVVITGVRSGESVARDGRINDRKEVAEGIWSNEHGDLRASPILDFTVDEVWERIGLCNAGVIESYSDFAGTMDLYRDAGGSSCVIVADMKMSGNSAPCGARTGCWACSRIGSRDKSLEQMIESDPKRYSYLKPLNRLRNWIVRSQYDWSLRQYVGRSIVDGHIEIAADTYSPETLRKLLIYTLTAEKLSGVPIISLEELILVDARWSLHGFFPPFTCLKTYFEVVDGGKWEQAPEIAYFPPTPVPRIGRIPVADTWYDATGLHDMVGLRDVGAEMFAEECGFQLKSLSNGASVLDYPESDSLTVDPQGASDFLSLMAQDYIRDYCDPDSSDWTYGWKTYLRMGIIQTGRGQSRATDEIMRRTAWRQENNLHGQRTLQELESRCTVLYSRQHELL